MMTNKLFLKKNTYLLIGVMALQSSAHLSGAATLLTPAQQRARDARLNKTSCCEKAMAGCAAAVLLLHGTVHVTPNNRTITPTARPRSGFVAAPNNPLAVGPSLPAAEVRAHALAACDAVAFGQGEMEGARWAAQDCNQTYSNSRSGILAPAYTSAAREREEHELLTVAAYGMPEGRDLCWHRSTNNGIRARYSVMRKEYESEGAQCSDTRWNLNHPLFIGRPHPARYMRRHPKKFKAS